MVVGRNDKRLSSAERQRRFLERRYSPIHLLSTIGAPRRGILSSFCYTAADMVGRMDRFRDMLDDCLHLFRVLMYTPICAQSGLVLPMVAIVLIPCRAILCMIPLLFHYSFQLSCVFLSILQTGIIQSVCADCCPKHDPLCSALAPLGDGLQGC